MYKEGKYVVGEIIGPNMPIMGAVIVSDIIQHEALRPLFFEIYGAGFFQIDKDNKVKIYGKSLSLGVESRDKDLKFVQRALGLVSE